MSPPSSPPTTSIASDVLFKTVTTTNCPLVTATSVTTSVTSGHPALVADQGC